MIFHVEKETAPNLNGFCFSIIWDRFNTIEEVCTYQEKKEEVC